MKTHLLDARFVRALALSMDLDLPLAPLARPRPRPRKKGDRPNARKASRQTLYRQLRAVRGVAGLEPVWVGQAFRDATGRWPRGYRTGEALR